MIRGLALRIDERLGGAGARAGVRPRPRALPASWTIRREVFPVRWALTLFHAIRGDLRVYREHADELMLQAEESGNPAYLHGRAPPGRRLARVPRRHGRIAPASSIAAASCTSRRSTSTYTAMYGLDPGMICAGHVEPSAVGARLSRPRRPARPRNADARPLAASADDARLRARRRAGHPPLSRRGAGGRRPWATRSSRCAASTS